MNEIQVLPPSPADDRIRIAPYRAVYSQPGLDRYAMEAVPPIHIIVNNGRVTLDGAVGSRVDKQLAYTQAMSVPGVFSATNNLPFWIDRPSVCLPRRPLPIGQILRFDRFTGRLPAVPLSPAGANVIGARSNPRPFCTGVVPRLLTRRDP
ncbi:MAG TPA: BON domain-containing protein [Candidatus Limnocylindrales bacterium]|nr:BON domain-containing protein [Candidatus Limnocylindrales bacterium]